MRKITVPALEKPRRMSLYQAIGEIKLPGDFAEFGVFRGASARFMLSLMIGDRKLHLFDSFEGLPEDWTGDKVKGTFKLEGKDVPQFDPRRTVIHRGWFKDTVPPYGAATTEPLAFIHMDADLYQSTIDVLYNINHLIVPDTIILFDEYVLGKSDDEHRAFVEWVEKYKRSFDYLWRSEGPQVCVRITE